MHVHLPDMCMLLGCSYHWSHWSVQAGVARVLLVHHSYALQSASPHDQQCLLAWSLGILIILYTCMTTGMRMKQNICMRRPAPQACM